MCSICSIGEQDPADHHDVRAQFLYGRAFNTYKKFLHYTLNPQLPDITG